MPCAGDGNGNTCQVESLAFVSSKLTRRTKVCGQVMGTGRPLRFRVGGLRVRSSPCLPVSGDVVELGRHAGLRNQCFGVRVRISPSPPCVSDGKWNTWMAQIHSLAGSRPASRTRLQESWPSGLRHRTANAECPRKGAIRSNRILSSTLFNSDLAGFQWRSGRFVSELERKPGRAGAPSEADAISQGLSFDCSAFLQFGDVDELSKVTGPENRRVR